MRTDSWVGLGSLLIAVVTLVVGWRLELGRRRRALRFEYLRSAYLRLISAAGRGPKTTESEPRAFEDAINDVYVFGDTRHIALARQFQEAFARDGEAGSDFTPLLVALREDIRSELGVRIDATPFALFRFTARRK